MKQLNKFEKGIACYPDIILYEYLYAEKEERYKVCPGNTQSLYIFNNLQNGAIFSFSSV
jgi:hypothetical protein